MRNKVSLNHVSVFVDHVYIVSRCLRQRSCWLVGKGYQERVFAVRMVRERGERIEKVEIRKYMSCRVWLRVV